MKTFLPHSLPPNDHFHPEEKFFHAVKHLHPNGRSVLPDAIRLPNISCNREAYRDFPEAVLVGRWPEFERVGVIVNGNLPGTIRSDGGVDWEFYVAHQPIEDNYSHTDVRLRAVGEEYSENKKPSSGKLKLQLRVSLAGKSIYFGGILKLIPSSAVQF